MTFPEIRYDFPKGGSNPFTVDSSDKYFIHASGLSNLSKTLNDFNFKNLEKYIPTGYKTILILERVAFYFNGQPIPDFNQSNTWTKHDRFYLISNKLKKTHVTEWNRSVESHSILRTTHEASLKSHIWEEWDNARNRAQKISAEDESTILICKVIDEINWH